MGAAHPTESAIAIHCTPRRMSGQGSTPLAILGWTLVGTGAGTLAAGGAMAGVTYDSMQQFERATRVVDQLRLRDQVREQSLVADVLFAAGGTLAAGGVVVLVVDALDGPPAEEADPEAARARLEPMFARGAAGCSSPAGSSVELHPAARLA